MYGNLFVFGSTKALPPVFTNAYRKIKTLYVILSEVELFLSEERGKSARLLADAGSRNKSRWLVLGCYIRVSKPPKLVKRSLRRFGALLPLVRLRSTRGSSTSLRMTCWLFILWYTFVYGRQNASPTRNFIAHRRDELRSPAFIF